MSAQATQAAIDRLIGLMATLRDPDFGCAWDLAQTPASIVPFTIEEAYEVADAVERGRPSDLRDELGDLLLQVVFQARLAQETGAFDFGDVVAAITAKLIRRHPHVFEPDGRVLEDGGRPTDPDAVAVLWNAVKARERAAARDTPGLEDTPGPEDGPRPDPGPFADIARALPALSRAEKISRRAASVGFDWPDPAEVVAKVREEIDEVSQAMAEGAPGAIAEEIGDLLFSVANLARHLSIDPEEALRRGNAKFERRFTAMTTRLDRDGTPLAKSDLAAMEAAWQAVKRDERKE
ncbi:nucleoside triphosphate hydrolase [Methylobacterium sp. Leaf399]|uniref:nucleoside triphosphate pyrophosphohydrolase n=1 Tax=Methylobacterium sp. Leaf399 TaxID=1736364 RepID=UPI0006FB6751|nr:nucleoside triphosphate pyrophosphohydrolase [Methylobacterium sp. Leaf399]KQT18884.1 nucleoside triphosphate hydrolase [Methylobacterium sp. Leaf399]